jgi:seryl-tRNA synthetase
LENYQEADGVRVPEVLVPFMGGIDFLPFERGPMEATKGEKKGKGKK